MLTGCLTSRDAELDEAPPLRLLQADCPLPITPRECFIHGDFQRGRVAFAPVSDPVELLRLGRFCLNCSIFMSHVRHTTSKKNSEEGWVVWLAWPPHRPPMRPKELGHTDCAHFSKRSLSKNKHLGSPSVDVTSQMHVVF